MKFSELPIDVQERLNENSSTCQTEHQYRISYLLIQYGRNTLFFSTTGLKPWNDDKGHYMPFGGGTSWVIRYGCVQFKLVRNPMGQIDYELCNGKVYGKSANGTIIPNSLPNKRT